MLKHKINLSLLAQDSTPIINLVQMDTGRELECTITDFSIPVGATAKLWVIKPSGKIVSANGAIDGNVVTVALSDQQVVESGLAVAQLKISSAGKIISSFSMYLNFQEDTSANGIVSTEDIKLVDAFLQEQSKKLDDAIALKTAQIQKNTQDVTTLKEDLTKLDTSFNQHVNNHPSGGSGNITFDYLTEEVTEPQPEPPTPQNVPVTSVSISPASASVKVNKSTTLYAIIQPPNATDQNVIWEVDNANAKVVNGVVTGLKAGNARVTVKTVDGNHTAFCDVTVEEVAVSAYKNLFDKNTMCSANEGISGFGIIGSYKWGLARVPVKENTQYSFKANDTKLNGDYFGALAGCFGFANANGEVIGRLSLGERINEANGQNALLKDYAHGTGSFTASNVYETEWVTFTTPKGCTALLFNTTLRNNADKIQLEEGNTIHNYYLPYA